MRRYAVCGVVMLQGKVLLVRHTYGMAKDRLLIPGGYVKEKELPTDAVVREIYEETKVNTEVESIISVQFKPEEWCIVFLMKYISGNPEPDYHENSEVMLLTAREALERQDLTRTSRVILQTIQSANYSQLTCSDFCPDTSKPAEYKIFGVL